MLNGNFYKTNSEIKLEAKECLRGNWKTLSLAMILFLAITIIFAGVSFLLNYFMAWYVALPVEVIYALLMPILLYGLNFMCLNVAKGEDIAVKNLFAGFSRKFGAILMTAIKKVILLIFWLVIFIIPMFIKAIGYSMSEFLIADRTDINSSNAIQESKHIMQQNYNRYFKFVLSQILWILLALVSGGIALIWVMPKLLTNKAVFYENLKTAF